MADLNSAKSIVPLLSLSHNSKIQSMLLPLICSIALSENKFISSFLSIYPLPSLSNSLNIFFKLSTLNNSSFSREEAKNSVQLIFPFLSTSIESINCFSSFIQNQFPSSERAIFNSSILINPSWLTSIFLNNQPSFSTYFSDIWEATQVAVNFFNFIITSLPQKTCCIRASFGSSP